MSDLYCDICGKQPVRAQILVEGAKMLACGSCMRGGKVLLRLDEDSKDNTGPIISHQTGPSFDSGEEVVENPGEKIRSAREKLKIPISVVAEKLREKESYLQTIESGRVQPPLELARKLEKELSIRLIESVGSDVTSTITTKKFSALTLGDVAEIPLEKKRKKGE